MSDDDKFLGRSTIREIIEADAAYDELARLRAGDALLQKENARLRKERNEARQERDDLYGYFMAYAARVRRAMTAQTASGQEETKPVASEVRGG